MEKPSPTTETGKILQGDGDFHDDQQRVLWPSVIQLGDEYFNDLRKHAVPLDERALAGLAHSAMGIDIYCWLAQRLHRIPANRPQLVPWVCLYAQHVGWVERGETHRNPE